MSWNSSESSVYVTRERWEWIYIFVFLIFFATFWSSHSDRHILIEWSTHFHRHILSSQCHRHILTSHSYWSSQSHRRILIVIFSSTHFHCRILIVTFPSSNFHRHFFIVTFSSSHSHRHNFLILGSGLWTHSECYYSQVWRVKYTLAKIRKAARDLLTLEEKDPRRLFEGNAILRRLVRIGVLDENRMKLDYVLGKTWLLFRF